MLWKLVMFFDAVDEHQDVFEAFQTAFYLAVFLLLQLRLMETDFQLQKRGLIRAQNKKKYETKIEANNLM